MGADRQVFVQRIDDRHVAQGAARGAEKGAEVFLSPGLDGTSLRRLLGDLGALRTGLESLD